MFDHIRARVLRLMRVPHDPDPPAGAPGSVRVFRAGNNLYKLRLLRWVIGQAGALVGIVVSLGFLAQLESGVENVRREILRGPKAKATAPASPAAPKARVESPAPAAPGAQPTAQSAEPETKTSGKAGSRARARSSGVQRLAEKTPTWLFPILTLLEWLGVAVYLLQLPITFAMVRLDYELRWYIVTDRSLRIRAGLASVQESTMSFANIQQVVVSQGPLQRLLGLADVRVQSAGGGGGEAEHSSAGESLHNVVFHGVDNAHEIRDLIAERLRQFRATGLGDPDETHAEANPTAADPAAADAVRLAARELLAETRALRAAVQ